LAAAVVLRVALVEVVGTEVIDRLATPQDVVRDDELAVADRDGRPLAAPSGGDPVVLRTDISTGGSTSSTSSGGRSSTRRSSEERSSLFAAFPRTGRLARIRELVTRLESLTP